MKMRKSGLVCLFSLVLLISCRVYASPKTGVRLTPSTLNFGSVSVNALSSASTATLTNVSNQTASIVSATSSLTEFILSGPSLPLALAPGKSVSFQVQFRPNSAGRFSGSLSFRVARTFSNSWLLNTAVTGSGTSPSSTSPTPAPTPAPPPAPAPTPTPTPTYLLSPSTTAASFGNVNVGSTSVQAVSLSNTGNSAVSISQVKTAGTGFSASGVNVPLNLAAGQSASLNLTFAPTSAGSVSGSVTLVSNASNSPASIALSGVAVQPQLSVVPASVGFGTVAVGSTNTQTMMVTNQGTANLSVSQATVSGTGFGLSPSALPMTVAPGKSGTLTVTFTPTTTARTTGNLAVMSNAPNSPVTVPLSGSGATTSSQLAASPTALNFANVSLGGSSSQTVTLDNTGNASASISQLTVTGAGFTASGLTTPLTLAAGQSTTFTVAFAPTAAGSVSGNVSVSSNATNSPTQISLSGTGAAPATSSGPLTAFPGAQGGGALSVGGRGGVVYLVTNTNDSGSGSLRACIAGTGARTCIFTTGGTINLLSTLTISSPYITIAGQTAPGGGIQLTGPSGANAAGSPALSVRTHDVIVQYLRVRRGYNAGDICNASPWSCGLSVQVIANSSSDNPYNIMFDHVSMEWSDYDSLGITGSATGVAGNPRSITVSWSIMGEELAGAGQMTATNFTTYSGQGSAAPDVMTDLDVHHSLFAGASHRMPLSTVKSGRFVNNIAYAWTYYGMRNKGFRDIIGNYFKTRNGQALPSQEIQAWTTNDGNDTSFSPAFYVTGNVGPSDPSGTNNWNMTALAVNQSGSEASTPLSTSYQLSSQIPQPTGYIPITPDPVSTISSPSGPVLNTARSTPYNGVGASRALDCNGNWVDQRDSVDNRIVNAVVNGTVLYPSQPTWDYSSVSNAPQSQANLGGFPTLAAGTACTSSLHDGIPDQWKINYGLSTTDTTLYQKTAPNGYTYLENYLNGTSPK